MAVYTIPFYQFCSDYDNIFPTYTLFDNSHKSELETKVKNHYFFHEIGFETEERMLKAFQTKWLEIIPLANKYYEQIASPKIKEFVNNYRDKTYTLDKDGHSNAGKTKSTADADNTYVDTPYTSVTTDNTYTTKREHLNSENTVEQLVNSTATSNDIYHEVISGLNDVSAIELLKKYKEIIFDVDMWIISQLHELFMEVY